MPATADIGVIGGGPAGCVLATRLAQFGFRVCLFERARFPRRHLGESLSAGVSPLLESIGLRSALEERHFPRVRRVEVLWDNHREREEADGAGLLVDRGPFDHLLLEHARACGVRVLQPATAEGLEPHDEGWRITVRTEERSTNVSVHMVADASGRVGVLPRRRRWTGPRTLALTAYWRGEGLPDTPRIEAGAHSWFWGVPIPGGLYNSLVFLDPRDLQHTAGSLARKLHTWIAESSLIPPGSNARVFGQIRVVDATPYLDRACVTAHSIKVGDAALALDPISSSGVQKAVQSALAASIVVNTILRRPENREGAQQFYSASLQTASSQHRAWAESHYAKVAATRSTGFWLNRAAMPTRPEAPSPAETAAFSPDTRVQLSADVDIVDVPCVLDRFVEPRPAVHHPSLTTPVAYLGEVELAPLLKCVQPGMTTRELARLWMPRVHPRQGLAIAQWLGSRGLLTPAQETPSLTKGGAR